MRILEINHCRKRFGENQVLNDISLSVEEGQVVSIIGPSGSGKSTLLRCATLLESMDGGELKYLGQAAVREENGRAVYAPAAELKKIRQCFGLVFQNFNLFPHYSVLRNITEAPMLVQKRKKEEVYAQAKELLKKMGLSGREAAYPYQLSGGMRQRVMIAMALACRPKILIADEPTTALDVTIQAQILKLMNELREKNGTAVLFITHDLGVINQMADNVAVMYCGQVVEYAPAETIFHKNEYSHPYTEGLMLSIPRLDTPSDERLEAIPGAVPHPLDLPKGCKFAPRCKYATERCLEEEPELIHVSDTQQVRCFYAKKEDRHAK